MLRRSKLATAGVAIALSAALGVLPAAAANAAPPVAAASSVAQNAPVVEDLSPVAVTDGAGFAGEITDLAVSVVDGALQATGTIQYLDDGVMVSEEFTAPVAAAANDACDILTLDLGPLFLDVLGLQVDLSPILLEITAVPGAGNLLGNLLCAVAGLLDGDGPLQGIVVLLNRLLTGLGL